MNYLAHAYQGLDDPYWVAGTALPDWMNVVDRKNRARRPRAAEVAKHADVRIAAVARGCVQHHLDDGWFHQQVGFIELSTQFAVTLRELLRRPGGHQAGFLGHIAVELLLDAWLIERDGELLDRYYGALERVDVHVVAQAAAAICPRPAPELKVLVRRFIETRFLADYVDDARLLYRLNGVMRRVGLPELPRCVEGWLADARNEVRRRATELLPHGIVVQPLH